MNRFSSVVPFVVLCTVLAACSGTKEPTSTTAQPANSGALQPGQASGSFTANGQAVELKYAYAGRGERFGTEATIILVTDKPIPADAIAQEIKTPALLQSEQLRGLEYVVDKDGLWLRFHPGPYQESTSMQLKEYAVEGDIVRGTDENDGSTSNGKYSRSVKFVATIIKP